MNTKPIFVKDELHEAVKVLAQRKFVSMGLFVENLIENSDGYLSYLEEKKQEGIKEELYNKYLKEKKLGVKK